MGTEMYDFPSIRIYTLGRGLALTYLGRAPLERVSWPLISVKFGTS